MSHAAPGPTQGPAETVVRYRHEAVGVILQVRGLDADPTRSDQTLTHPTLCCLAWQRRRDPFAGAWALPSGPLAPDETLEQSVRRHLAAGLDLATLSHLEQLGTSSSPTRDPWQRTVATAYLGTLPADLDPVLPETVAWLPVDSWPHWAFDHGAMVNHGVARLRAKLSYTNLGFALSPREFTMATLRDIYSAALGYPIEVTNLQRVLARRGQLVATGERTPSGRAGGRPASVHRFAAHELQVTDPFATLKPHLGGQRPT